MTKGRGQMVCNHRLSAVTSVIGLGHRQGRENALSQCVTDPGVWLNLDQ